MQIPKNCKTRLRGLVFWPFILFYFFTPIFSFTFNQLGMRGGMIAPQQFYGEVFKPAPMVSLFTRFDAFESGNWFLRDLRFEPEFGFTQLNFRDSDSKFQIFTLGVNAIYMINWNFLPSRVSPFIGLGAGYYYGSLSLSKLQENNVYSNPSFRGLAGADILLAYNFGLSVGATYDYIYDKGDSLRAFGGFLSVQYNFATSNVDFLPVEIIRKRAIYPSMSAIYASPNPDKDGRQIRRPLARFRFKNNTQLTAQNVKVTLCIPELMAGGNDPKSASCTLSQEFPAIPGKTEVEASLHANFDGRQFLNVLEDKQVDGTIHITGLIDGSQKSLEKPVPVTFTLKKLNDFKWVLNEDAEDNAVLTEERIVSFMTPDHPDLGKLRAEITALKKNIAGLNEPLQNAILVYTALRQYGIKYAKDPKSDKSDRISFPFATMTEGGDCDDLVVLYGTLLYLMGGMDIAFVTTSNHIFAMINTGEPIQNRDKFFANGDSVITFDNSIWVPIEVTELGNSDFMEAWRKGATQYKQATDKNIIRVNSALEWFPAAGWHGKEKRNFQLRNVQQVAQEVAGLVNLVHEKAMDLALKPDIEKLRENQKAPPGEKEIKLANDHSRIGAIYGMFGKWDQAKQHYEKSLKFSENMSESHVGLGNCYFELSDNKAAEKEYLRALELIERDSASNQSAGANLANILATLAEYYYHQPDMPKAKSFLDRAVKLDESIAKQYAHIRSNAKASEAGRSQKRLLWIKP